MRKAMFWSSLFAAALLGSACKKEPSEKAGEQSRKSVEEVGEQKKDVREEQKAVTEEQREAMKQQRELSQAQGEAAQARQNYITTMRERLAKIDAKISQLDARTDAESKNAAVQLRARRDAFAAKLDTASTYPAAGWNTFSKDLDTTIDKLDKDVDETLR